MTDDELIALQAAAGLAFKPTPLTFDLRRAVSGQGPRAYDWSDKPHRLLYDACREIEQQSSRIQQLETELAATREANDTFEYDEPDDDEEDGCAFECAGFTDMLGEFYCPMWGTEECDWECPYGGKAT
mgnify:CR=1 FL=1